MRSRHTVEHTEIGSQTIIWLFVAEAHDTKLPLILLACSGIDRLLAAVGFVLGA